MPPYSYVSILIKRSKKYNWFKYSLHFHYYYDYYYDYSCIGRQMAHVKSLLLLLFTQLGVKVWTREQRHRGDSPDMEEVWEKKVPSCKTE